MIKTLITTALLTASAASATADPLPAPPTVKYNAPASQACETQTLQVYFPAGTSALTPAAKTMLAEAKSTLEGCMIGPAALQVVAADAASLGEAGHLAEARIVSVSTALDQYQLSQGPVARNIRTVEPARYTAPNDRRVEIRLSAWTPEIG
ncbi:MAG: hypothetical protein AAGJ68_08595 [Pseudomonadota bacterium]